MGDIDPTVVVVAGLIALLSGLLYQWYGLVSCLWASVGFVLVAGLLSVLLPTTRTLRTRPI